MVETVVGLRFFRDGWVCQIFSRGAKAVRWVGVLRGRSCNVEACVTRWSSSQSCIFQTRNFHIFPTRHATPTNPILSITYSFVAFQRTRLCVEQTAAPKDSVIRSSERHRVCTNKVVSFKIHWPGSPSLALSTMATARMGFSFGAAGSEYPIIRVLSKSRALRISLSA